MGSGRELTAGPLRKVLVAAPGLALAGLALTSCSPAPSAAPAPAPAPASVPTPVASLAGPQAGTAGQVTRLVDGDTLWVSGVKVRLIGMDTPETHKPGTPVQCFGEAASHRMANLLPVGTAVRLVYDRGRLDRYGRTLAYVYRASDGLFVNAQLVREGYARALTISPDTAHHTEFEALELQARRAGLGRWSACHSA